MANVAPAGVTPVARLALSLAILVLNGPTKKIKQPGCLEGKQILIIIPDIIVSTLLARTYSHF